MEKGSKTFGTGAPEGASLHYRIRKQNNSKTKNLIPDPRNLRKKPNP